MFRCIIRWIFFFKTGSLKEINVLIFGNCSLSKLDSRLLCCAFCFRCHLATSQFNEWSPNCLRGLGRLFRLVYDYHYFLMCNGSDCVCVRVCVLTKYKLIGKVSVFFVVNQKMPCMYLCCICVCMLCYFCLSSISWHNKSMMQVT